MNNDLSKVQERLVKENMELVGAIAKNWATEESFQELYNAALIGLVTAAKQFQPDKSIKFPSYAVWFILREINLGFKINAI